MHINPAFPNVGDSNWGGPLDTALNTIVSKVNALDDALASGASVESLSATYLSKAAPPTLDGVARFRAMVRGGAIVAPGTGVKAFDTSNEPPNQQWFIDAYTAGFRLYIAHGTYWDSDAPYPDIEPLLGQAIYAGMKVALYTRNPAWYREGIAAAGKYTNQLQFFALDVETDPGVQVTRAMVDDIKSMGIRPIIYTGSGMWPQVMGNSSAFSDVPLWDTNTAAIDYTTWTANLNSPAPQQYAGWNDLGTMRVGVQQKFDQVVNGIDLDLNTFDPAFLGMAKTGPLIGIGDDHTDVTTSAQYFWQRLQTVGNQSGNGLAGVPSGAIVPQGNNQQKLYDYLYGLDSNNTLRAALDLKPSVIVASWLTHDVRQGRLGLTVDGIRIGGSALLHELINRIQATNPEALIVLRVPFPYTTVDDGSHYITDGTNVNPAGLAQIYTDGVRLAYYDAQRMHPDVILYDPQTRLTGTTSPTANTGWWANQITQSQSGYQAEADDFAAFFVAPPSATQLAATYATRLRVLASQFRPASQPLSTVPASGLPTVTWGTTTTLARHISPLSSQLTLLGKPGVWDDVNFKYATNGAYIGADFILTGQNVEIGFKEQISNGSRVWVFVDGAPITATDGLGTTTSGGGDYVVKLVFGASARRRITVHLNGVNSFAGLNVDFTTSVVAAPPLPRIAFVGDSFMDGSAAASQFQYLAFDLTRLLDVNGLNGGRGGTGYVTGVTFGDSGRVADIVAFNPDLIVVIGSVNDDGASGVQAAASALYSAYATALPHTPVIVFGPQPSGAAGTLSSGRAATNAAVKAAAVAAPNVLAYFDMIGTAAGTVPPAFTTSSAWTTGQLTAYKGSVYQFATGPQANMGPYTPDTDSHWVPLTYAYSGTGQVGSTTGDGTRDVMVYSDGIHPTAVGAMALADRVAREIRTLIAR